MSTGRACVRLVQQGGRVRRTLFFALLAILGSDVGAFAHHVMGRDLPATFGQGLLSGLGHPVIGLDHLAALIAAGCLAALHRGGALLVGSFVLAMAAGAALHMRELTLPGSEALVAVSVIMLGLTLVPGRIIPSGIALALFAAAGFVHGYALAESIIGAERAPLLAYLIGLVAIQTALALAVMAGARLVTAKATDVLPLRLIGAGIAGIGIALAVSQLMPGA